MHSELMQAVTHALQKTLNTSAGTKMLPETRLKDDLGLDSMTSLTFLMALEETLEGFHVDPETLNMDDLDTIQSITTYIAKQLEGSLYAK